MRNCKYLVLHFLKNHISTVEIIKHTVDAVATPAISPKFVEIDDNFVETDGEFEERNDVFVVDIVKFVVLNTQVVEVVVAILVLGFTFVVLDGTIVDRAFVKEELKFQSFAVIFVLL